MAIGLESVMPQHRMKIYSIAVNDRKKKNIVRNRNVNASFCSYFSLDEDLSAAKRASYLVGKRGTYLVGKRASYLVGRKRRDLMASDNIYQ
jgi:hypothetical protein